MHEQAIAARNARRVRGHPAQAHAAHAVVERHVTARRLAPPGDYLYRIETGSGRRAQGKLAIAR